MKKEHRVIVRELSDYLFDCFNRKSRDFIIDGIFFGEQHSICISGFMSALANVMLNCAMATDCEEVIKETRIYIEKLLKSVPDSNCDILDMRKH